MVAINIDTTPRSPEEVSAELISAKLDEARAAKRRISLEEELVTLLGQREEGAETHNLEGYKVVITSKVNRKIDWKAYDALEAKIPADLRPVKIVRELDATGVKYLQNNEPKIYQTLAKSLTITPAKTSVTVTRIEE